MSFRPCAAAAPAPAPGELGPDSRVVVLAEGSDTLPVGSSETLLGDGTTDLAILYTPRAANRRLQLALVFAAAYWQNGSSSSAQFRLRLYADHNGPGEVLFGGSKLVDTSTVAVSRLHDGYGFAGVVDNLPAAPIELTATGQETTSFVSTWLLVAPVYLILTDLGPSL